MTSEWRKSQSTTGHRTSGSASSSFEPTRSPARRSTSAKAVSLPSGGPSGDQFHRVFAGPAVWWGRDPSLLPLAQTGALKPLSQELLAAANAKESASNDCEDADMPRQPIPRATPEEALAGKQLTPRMLRVLAAAAGEAERRGHSFVGTEHALLGLLSEPDGIAGMVLTRLDAADAAGTETRRIMDSEGYNRPRPRPRP